MASWMVHLRIADKLLDQGSKILMKPHLLWETLLQTAAFQMKTGQNSFLQKSKNSKFDLLKDFSNLFKTLK